MEADYIVFVIFGLSSGFIYLVLLLLGRSMRRRDGFTELSFGLCALFMGTALFIALVRAGTFFDFSFSRPVGAYALFVIPGFILGAQHLLRARVLLKEEYSPEDSLVYD